MTDLYYAACCQTDFPCPADRDEIADRTRRMCAMAEQTIVGYEPFHDVRLLVFPEFAHAAPIYDSVEVLTRRLAVPVPNEHTGRYQELAARYGCYIQTGTFIEVDPDNPAAYCKKGRAYLGLGNDGVLLENAVEAFTKAIALDPTYAPAYRGRADAYTTPQRSAPTSELEWQLMQDKMALGEADQQKANQLGRGQICEINQSSFSRQNSKGFLHILM